MSIPRLRFRPQVFQTTVLWAVIAGAGASMLAMKLAAGILFTLYSESGIDDAWRGPLPVQWTQLIGAVVGTAVALTAGGWRTLIPMLALNAVVIVPSLARSADCLGDALCPTPELLPRLLANWPFVFGVLASIGCLDILVRKGSWGRNSLLESAGVYAVSSWLLLTLLPLVLTTDGLEYTVRSISGMSATVATSVVCAHRSSRPVRDAVLIATCLVVANVPAITSQVGRNWVLFQVIDARVMNVAALGILSGLLLVPLVWLVDHLVAEPPANLTQSVT